MPEPREFEFVFEAQEEGGYHVYAPELPGLHTEEDDLDEALANAVGSRFDSAAAMCE